MRPWSKFKAPNFWDFGLFAGVGGMAFILKIFEEKWRGNGNGEEKGGEEWEEEGK